MTQQHEAHNEHRTQSIAKWVFVGFLLVAGYFLVMEHRAHLAGWLSAYGVWLLLLSCPLMHLFMHGGHGHREHRPAEPSNDPTKVKK